jgi:hypothetical protein
MARKDFLPPNMLVDFLGKVLAAGPLQGVQTNICTHGVLFPNL